MATNADPYNLQRFVDAQEGIYDRALSELQDGQKQSHWMWFVFPQVAGLGHSAMSRLYSIHSIDEAKAFLDHPLLGARMRECVQALLIQRGERDAKSILGAIDAMKLRSSLTLFAKAAPGESLFGRALDIFFGSPDPSTLRILGSGQLTDRGMTERSSEGE